MCGIFGLYSYRVPRTRREILECLLTGLRRLEYRGYDSAGVCIDASPVLLAADGAPQPPAVDGQEGVAPGKWPLALPPR